MTNDQSDRELVASLPKLQRRYADVLTLRASVQAIPYIGGSLDTLLAGRSAQIHLERVEKFAIDLAHRLEVVESSAASLNDDAFSDLVLSTFEKVARTRSDQKRLRFAEIIANQVANPKPWEESESAVRLLSDLEDIHIEIVGAALCAPIASGVFAGVRVVSLEAKPRKGEDEDAPASLIASFPQYGAAALRMACAELISKGLLHDEGIGRLQTGAMRFFVSTDLAEWLSGWITIAHRE